MGAASSLFGLSGDAWGGIGSGIGGIGTGIGDFISASGDRQSASYYRKAAAITQLQTAVKEEGLKRDIYQTIGKGVAEEAGNGFIMSGSAADVARSSAQQGGLAKGIVSLQGQMQEQAYLGQAQAADSAASASTAGGIGSILGGVLGIGAAIFGI